MHPAFAGHQGFSERLLCVREKTIFPHIVWCAGWNVVESVHWQGANFFLLLEYLHSKVYIPCVSAQVVWFSLLFGATSKWGKFYRLVSLLSSLNMAPQMLYFRFIFIPMSVWYLCDIWQSSSSAAWGNDLPNRTHSLCVHPTRHTFQVTTFLSPLGLSSPFSSRRSPPQGGCLDLQLQLGSLLLFLRTSCASLWQHSSQLN